jgi:outer membrane protein assembly factor BamD (BamD/ComL family)
MLHFNKLSSTEPFNKAYDKAMTHYLKSNWNKAHKYFEKCLVMKPNDGPCTSNIEFIKEHNLDPEACGYKGY